MNEAFAFSDYAPLLPEIVLAVLTMILLMAGAFTGNKSMRLISYGGLGAIVITGLTLVGLDWHSRTIPGGMIILDGFAGFVKLLILAGLAAVLAISMRYLQQERIGRFEYPVLVLLAGLGMMLMVSANDLLSLYLALELQSLSLYVLAAFHRDLARSAESGIKYFVLGAISSGMILFGASLIYGFAGTTSFDGIASAVSEGEHLRLGLLVGLVFVLSGLAFKISAAPFHMWTPDVYQGAPTSVTALFAIVPKIAALALLIRLLYQPFGGMTDDWSQIIYLLSLASMALGAFAALVQDNIKRLLAYSSIGHVGYALIGVVTGTEEGIGAVLFYGLVYMVMSAGVFAFVLAMRRDGYAAEKIEDLAGLVKNRPFSAYAMTALLFSMAGIPPLAGFFAKLFVFQEAVAAGYPLLAVIGVLTSVVAAFYYLKLIKIMLFDEPSESFDPNVSFSSRLVMTLCSLFVILYIFAPEPLRVLSYSAASVLSSG